MSGKKVVKLLYGRDGIELSVPKSTDVLEGQAISAISDAQGAVAQGLRFPIGCKPLGELVRKKQPKSVVITISDITRPVPNKVIVPAILEVLNEAGVGDEQICILIATGMHRPSTAAERDFMLGEDLQKRCKVVDHDAEDEGMLRQVTDDPPVAINTHYLDADFRIVTGLIEPHFMAGFSGGRKGVCPGIADLNTVQRFHGYKIMGDEMAENGVLDGNPCHEESLRVAKIVGMDFLVNVAITHERKVAGVYCGDMQEAHLAGCEEVAKWNMVKIECKYDLVVTNGGGYPLDASYYQTVKGMCTALPAAHERSVMLIASGCEETVGSPEYTELMMKWGDDWQGFLKFIEGSGITGKDQWQYQMQTRVLKKIGQENLRLVTDGLSEEVAGKMGVTVVGGEGSAQERLQVAVDGFLAENSGARVGVIAQGPYVMVGEGFRV